MAILHTKFHASKQNERFFTRVSKTIGQTIRQTIGRSHRDTSIQKSKERSLCEKTSKRAIFHASEQNDRANDSANDWALIELGGSTTTNFKMTMKISKPESIPQFDKMTFN